MLYERVIEGYLPHPKHYYDFSSPYSGHDGNDGKPLHPIVSQR